MNTIMCGFTQSVITPLEEGIFMDGYGFRMVPASGAHDDLYAKTAVFQDKDGEKFAIVVMDILGFNTEIYELLADYIGTITGFDKEHLALCGIHSHSGPASGMIDGLPINYDYWCHTAEICANSILEASARMCKCRFSSAIADTELLSSVNRRGRLFNDRRIRAAVFTDMEGNIRGVISTANCHPVINTTQEMSADYPQILTRESIKKYNVPFLFLLGRSADINPHPDIMDALWDGIETLGTELSTGVFNAAEKASSASNHADKINSAYKLARIPMKPFPSLDEMEKNIRENMRTYTSLPWSKEKHYALRELEWHRHMYHRAKQGLSSDIFVPLQVFTIGKQIVFVFIPFETMTLTGNKIEEFLISQGYKEENIYVASCSNSVNGYLAALEEFPYGGYEVSGASHWYGLPECSKESEGAVIKAVKELVMTL